MNILQINTTDLQGGAARAAYRLHNGLLHSGVSSRMLVASKMSSDDTVCAVSINNNPDINNYVMMSELIQAKYIDKHRSPLSNTLFTYPYPGYKICDMPIVNGADIINLHWISYFLSPLTIKQILDLRVPIVWTLHDMAAFTGGCHYSSDCINYTSSCNNCPQLTDDPFSLPNSILNDKIELFNGCDLTIVTPSNWLAKCAKKSQLFKNKRIEVIANSVETELFAPISKSQARSNLGISESDIVLLCGADSLGEKRKGFEELVNAVSIAVVSGKLNSLISNGNLKIVSFGSNPAGLSQLGLPIVDLGYLRDEFSMVQAYSAADLFILPSLEDNLPNMMLESMSCGTPVLAFSIGGIPDAVQNGYTGKLVNPYDINDFAISLVNLVLDASTRSKMSSNARDCAISKYSLNVQAENYINLYKELLSDKSNGRNVHKKEVCNYSKSELTCLDINTGPATNVIFDKLLVHILLTELSSTLKNHNTNTELLATVSGLNQEITAIKSSLSWTITRPLRWLGDIILKILRSIF